LVMLDEQGGQITLSILAVLFSQNANAECKLIASISGAGSAQYRQSLWRMAKKTSSLCGCRRGTVWTYDV